MPLRSPTKAHAAVLVTVLTALLATVGSLCAQENEPGNTRKPILREQTVYVPFTKLDDVFEKEGRGIFLPYEEFLKLWQAAQPTPEPPVPDDPPADAVLRGGRYSGSVEGDVARLDVTFGLEALKRGWSEVRLPLRNVAVENVTLRRIGDAADGAPQALFANTEKGYSVYLPDAGQYEAQLTFSVRVGEEPGKKTVRFGIPQAAVSRLELVIPEEDARIDVEPSLAVQRSTKSTEDAQTTRVEAFLGNASEVAVSWMPAIGREGDGGAIVSATQSIRTTLGERRLTVSTDIHYAILQGQVDTFRVAVPEGTRLISIRDDENRREWSQEDADGTTFVVVRLHAAAKKKYSLGLSFERILDKTPETLALPFPRTDGVFSESGYAVLGYDSGLKVRITDSQGLSQLDPEDVPNALRKHLGVGFRYLAQPLELELAIEKILPLVRNQSTSVVTLGREEDVWIGWIDYDIQKAGVFRLEFRVPEDWSVAEVGSEQTVEAFQTADADGQRTVSVSLKSKAIGSFQLPFRLVRSGNAAPGEVTLAPPIVLGSTQDRGIFGVSAPRAIDVLTRERQNMVDAHENELFRSGIMGQLSSQAGIPRTYRYREQPASVRLALEQKKTEIDVLAQHLVEVADGEIRVTHLLDYEVRYAEVDRLRFRAPSSLDDVLKVDTKQKTEVRKVSTAGGVTLWEVTLTPRAKGLVPLIITHAQDLKALQSGVPFPYSVPLVSAADATTQSGFVALRKEGTLEIVSQTVEMDAIDTGELPTKLRRGRIYSAFRYFGESPALALNLTRHEYQRLADAAIQLVRVQTVLTRESRVRSYATLFLQNTGRQYLELDLRPETIITLAVGGKTQSPKKAGSGESTLVEIPTSSGAGGTFAVEVLFEGDGAREPLGPFGSIELKTLGVGGEIPVSQVELSLHLPPEYRYFGFGGNLHRNAGGPDVWSRFKKLLEVGTTYSQDRSAPEQMAGARAQSLTVPRGGGIEVDLPVDGLVSYRFKTLAPVGTVQFYYTGNTLFSLFDFAAFLLTAAVAYWWLNRRSRARLAPALVFILIPLAISWFLRGPPAEIFTSMAAGSAIVALGFVLLFVREKWRDVQATRVALAPDPYLEGADAQIAQSRKTKPPETVKGNEGVPATDESDTPPQASSDDAPTSDKKED